MAARYACDMPANAPDPTPQAIADALTELQRDIVSCGPTSFAEADAIPEDLFTCGEIWESDSGDEWLVWEPTDLGLAVRDFLEREAGREKRVPGLGAGA